MQNERTPVQNPRTSKYATYTVKTFQIFVSFQHNFYNVVGSNPKSSS